MLELGLVAVVWLIVVGVVLYFLDRAPFIAADVKPAIRWVILALTAIAFIIWLLRLLPEVTGHHVVSADRPALRR